jgi:hypothetical protein
MAMILKSHLTWLCWNVLCCLGLVAGAWAQDSANADAQVPLGDVAKRQREQRQHSKAAKKVVSDDDIPANHMHWMNGFAAEFKIIPAIRISGLVPNDDSATAATKGEKKDKIYVQFGPHLTDPYSCNDGSLDCAEEWFLKKLQRGGMRANSARILFDSDEEVQEFPARVVHFEVLDDVRGKMQGTAALIETPVTIVTASCMYGVRDQSEAEAQCDAFISSLRIDIPEKFIYVEHH